MTKSNWLVLFIIGFSTTFLGGCETMSGAMRGAQKDLGKAASFLDGKDERAQNLSVENSQYDKSHSRNRNSKRTRK